MKKIVYILFIALVLNIIWENLHSVLYVNYQGGIITEHILLRASLWDALMIVAITFPFFFLPKRWQWGIFLLGFVIAVGIEWWALQTGRWAYTSAMPIIPFLSVGLTPALQLGLLGLASFKIQEKILS